MDVTCKTVANMIKGKTPEEIRKTFNIKNDFTPSEEEQVRYLSFNKTNILFIFSICNDFFIGRSARRTSGVRKNEVSWIILFCPYCKFCLCDI